MNSLNRVNLRFEAALLVGLMAAITVYGQAAKKSPSVQVFPDHCPDGRPLPFGSIEVQHSIDLACRWTDGKQTSPAPSKLQNAAKNNFCSTTPLAQAETYTPQKLIDLQSNTHILTGQGKEPASRSEAQQLGEGKLIRIAAFIVEAHFADVGTGESVNCGQTTETDNDIHIALAPKATTAECGSVTAEISPHYRPTSWEQIGHFQTFNTATNKYDVNQSLKTRLQAQTFRFTGQLFFDSSHSPCPCGTSCSPSRSTDWEIHPVYQIDVCKSGTQCNADKDADWTSFDQWWNTPSGNTPPKKK